jgi:hypothetical protein
MPVFGNALAASNKACYKCGKKLLENNDLASFI